MHITKFTILSILTVQFISVKYIHITVQQIRMPFITKTNPVPIKLLLHIPPSLQPLAIPLFYFLSLGIGLFHRYLVQVEACSIGLFCDYLISLSVRFARFIHVVMCARISLLVKAGLYSLVYVYHILFIPLSVTFTFCGSYCE